MVTDGETKRVTMNLPKELVEKLDVIANVLFKNRTELTKEALREFLETMEIEGGVREMFIEEYLKGELEFEDLKIALGPYDAKSVETARSIYDRGEELAKEIAQDL